MRKCSNCGKTVIGFDRQKSDVLSCGRKDCNLIIEKALPKEIKTWLHVFKGAIGSKNNNRVKQLICEYEGFEDRNEWFDLTTNSILKFARNKDFKSNELVQFLNSY